MMRAARRARGVSYLLAHAESTPFLAASFDAATCCSGVHWFDQDRGSSPSWRRVLTPTGWVGLYDHYFTGEMIDVPEFGAWLHEALVRYPLPPRNPQVGDPRSVTPAGFERIGDETFTDDVVMTHEQLTDYQLTISNMVAAVEQGTARDGVAGVGARNDGTALRRLPRHAPIRFVGSITCLRVA